MIRAKPFIDAGGVDPAVAQARAVVGLYGDPAISWSIALDVSLASAVDPVELQDRARSLVSSHLNLGAQPVLGFFTGGTATAVLSQLLDARYGDRDPLVRLALSEDGSRLFLAAHHGAVDGLGLLALLSVLIECDVVSTAQGVGNRASPVGFLRSSLSRLVEAVFTPPTRLASDVSGSRRGRTAKGDVIASVSVPMIRANTAGSVAAAAQALAEWNRAHDRGSSRLVVAVGASRRDGRNARPDRDTAYLRVRLRSDLSVQSVRDALAQVAPEPTFPERPIGGWSTVVTRALRRRLGSSLLVSNLGLVQVPSTVRSIAFYPSAAGPQALAVGVASTTSYTTVTARMPRADFTDAAATSLSTTIADRLVHDPAVS